jgi:DNA repair exonuclease SbcCD nuclease subunit
MKFAHIADVHIGSWRDPKLKDISTQAFIKAIDESIRENVDFILISGDLFNTALPGIDQLKTVIRKLKDAKNKGISVYYIAGSHDFSPSGKTMLDIIEEADLGVNVTRGEINEEGNLILKFTVDKKTGAKITGMIGKRGMLEKKYYENLDKTNLESEKGFKIFMFHTALDEMKPENLKDMESSPASFLPKGFDYYAGGHVHIVKIKDLSEHGYKNLVYPGPVFPANFSELEKLEVGGFYIYSDGNLTRKEISIFKTINKNLSINNLTAEQCKEFIQESFENDNIKDKIILIRVTGKLKSGRVSEIDFKSIIQGLYDKDAYYVMKNISRITTDEFEKINVEQSNTDEIENKIITEHLNQIPHNFKDEKDATVKLMKSLSQEKHEGEKVSDYDSRLKKDVDIILK